MRSTKLAVVGAQRDWDVVDLVFEGDRHHLRVVGKEPGDRFGNMMNGIVANHQKVCYETSISVDEMRAFLGCLIVMRWGDMDAPRTPHRAADAQALADQMMLALLRNPEACGLELGKVTAA